MKAESKSSTPDLGPAITRLRQIAAESYDHLLLADGPPSPDAKLLDMCAEATHAYILSRKARQRRPVHDLGREWTDADSAADKAALADSWAHQEHGRKLAREIGKLVAATPAGIYAKATVVRASRTGVALLGVSLAEDLLANRALREILWPGGAPEPEIADNVVTLEPRQGRREAAS